MPPKDESELRLYADGAELILMRGRGGGGVKDGGIVNYKYSSTRK